MALLMATFATCAVRAQGGRPMAVDDLLAAIRIADPQLSPDGRTVIYLRTTTDLKSGRRNADIWRVPADGGTPHELIAGERSENTPRFSADGRAIAAVSHDGTVNLWRAPTWPEIERLTKANDAAR